MVGKLFIMEVNAKLGKKWCHDHKTWKFCDWKNVECFDEESFTFFPANDRDFPWWIPKEAYDPDCLFTMVKLGGCFVTI